MIACVHISNICNTANVTTARLTITENTVITLCSGGVSFHFVFIAYSAFLLPSLSKVFLSAFSVGKIGAIRIIKSITITIEPTVATISSPLPMTKSMGKTEMGSSSHPRRNHSLPSYWLANSQVSLFFIDILVR